MLDDIRSASNGEGKWNNVCVESFVTRLRDRPWIEPELVDVIAHGLRTAVRDPDPSLWEKLRQVISG
jgi:hypothetical protein